jgi:hypothetical protein
MRKKTLTIVLVALLLTTTGCLGIEKQIKEDLAKHSPYSLDNVTTPDKDDPIAKTIKRTHNEEVMIIYDSEAGTLCYHSAEDQLSCLPIEQTRYTPSDFN